MLALSIVIPTYNEKKNIGILIKNIAEAFKGISYTVLVVDDNSPDGTGEEVHTLATQGYPVKLILKEKKEGIGAALRVGYQQSQTPIIASTDADLSFDPKDLKRLYDNVSSGQSFVVGTRHSKGSFYETPNYSIWIKHLVSLLGNRVLRTLTGIPLDDFSGNFRVFTKDLWQAIETEENTNTLLFEMILKSYVKGYSIGQIPVAFRDRRYGSSKLRLSWEAPNFFIKLLKYLRHYWPELIRRRFGTATVK